MSAVPLTARRLGTYFYGRRGEIQVHVWAERRCFYLRDENGNHPKFLAGGSLTGTRMPHPGDGTEDVDIAYDTVGLFYGYPMPDTGWDGDC
jgi:hypothetical protein